MEFTPDFTSVSPWRRRIRPLAGAALAVAATVLLPPAAVAADKARAASAPPAKTAVLSPAQLKQCLSQKDGLRQRNDALLKSKADLVAAKAEIDRTGAESADAQATLDRTKKDMVDAFNEKIVARNALIDNYQAKAATYNKEVEGIQATQESYATACSNRRYDDRDLSDIQRKK